MSNLLRSALGYFNDPSAAGPGGAGQQAGGQAAQYGGGSGASDETSAVGDVIGFQCGDQKKNIRIAKLIAEGGFSYVYRGVDSSSGELVAVKKMLAPDPDAVKNIEQEIEFARQFQHDNIIKFYGSITRPSGRLKEYFIAMEYCSIQLPTPPLRLQHTTQVFGQTCKAIKYLHDFGIVHRDIKLENILIGSDGLVKLVDFGSATMEKIYPTPDWSMSKRTLVEEQIAQKTTPMYRAPEMLDLWSNYPIDEHSDMWALGCLAFCLNFGQHPFQDSNKLAITNANYNLPKNASDANPIVVIIRGLLKVNPLERISFGQIFELLQSIAECEGFSINGKLPFKPVVSPVTTPPSVGGSAHPSVGNGAPHHHANRPPPPQHQHHPSSHGSGSGGGGGGGSLFSSIKGVGSSLLKNIKEQSQQYMYGPGTGPPTQPGSGSGSQQQHPSPGPPGRPPPPPSNQHHHHPPPSRPAPPSPRQPTKGQHLEFENREYEMMQQREQGAHPPAPHRPAPPKPPPPRASPVPEPVQETVGNLLDISLDASVNQPITSQAPAAPTTNTNLLEDLFGSNAGAPASNNQSNATPSFADELLWGSGGSSGVTSSSNNNVNERKGQNEMNLLGDTTDPFASLLGKSASSGPTPTGTTGLPSFGIPSFGGTSAPSGGGVGPMLQPGAGSGGGGGGNPIPTSASFQNLNFAKTNNQQPQPQNFVSGMDFLGSNMKNNSSSIPKNSSTPNLLSDLILDDIIGPTSKMNVGQGQQKPNIPPAPSASGGNNMNKSNPSINQFGNSNGNGSSKPNYNRHQIFDASPTNAAPEKKQTLNDAFGDILSSQGFSSTKGGQQARTINDMRKIEMLQNPNVDPVQLKVNEWREGKKKNIRALLASLHTVTWEGCNWEETNMSQMITPAQVKKIYRKACLAIHPDKQMGKEWEQLAKLLFVELNEAWAAFEESQQT